MKKLAKIFFSKGILISFLFLIFIVSIFTGCSDKTFEIKLVITGLTNGNLLPFKERFGPDKGRMLGGMACRNAALKKLVSSSPKESTEFIFIDQGDLLSGTPEAYYTKGKCLVETYNQAPCDVLLVGNREFDFGLDILKLRASEAKFKFLVSNIKDSTGKTPDYFKYRVEKSIRGLNFHVYGFIPDDTKDMTPEKNIPGLNIIKLSEAVKKITSESKGKSDFTILLTQLDKDRQTKEIDTLLSSDIDLLTALSFDYNSCGYEKIKSRDFVKVYGYAKGAEITVITFSADPSAKKITFKSSERIILRNSDNAHDGPTNRIVVDYTRKIDSIMDRKIGTAESLIDNYYDEESPLGNIICDVMREETEAEIVLQNPGGIKRPLRKGDIKARDMYDILPFDNEIVVMNLKGSDVKGLLEKTIKKEYGLLQVSGLSYKFKTKKEGDPVLLEVKVDGTPLQENRIYKVATNSFMASGGDKFVNFKNGTHKRIMGSLRSAVEKWILKNSPIKQMKEHRISEVRE